MDDSGNRRRKIHETVTAVLKTADLETATEETVRKAASEILGVDLSDIDSKLLVRQAVETYLMTPESVDGTPQNDVVGVRNDVVRVRNGPNSSGEDGKRDGEARFICKLSEKRSISVQKVRGTTLVMLNDYYLKNGQQIPSGKGISLTSSQWSMIKSRLPDIEEAIVKMESRIRDKGSEKRVETDTSTSSSVLNSQRHVPAERSQIEADISNSAATISPQGLVPIVTTRLNGKNYYCWMHQMEFFLKQLKVAYVLTEPCPIVPVFSVENVEALIQAKTNVQKWVDDDYICRHNILNSLSDNLFDQYSMKPCSARQLWLELKLAFDDDFGTKRSQVNKYIQFQIVDGVSVVEQVEELHKIADSIVTSGVWFDEYFHVGAIVSKLPPSWKECREKLMREEPLTLNTLMYRLRDEEESRNHEKTLLCRNGHVLETNHDKNKEDNCGPKRVTKGCFKCGDEGHFVRNCPQRRPKVKDQGNGNDENNGVMASLEVNMVEE